MSLGCFAAVAAALWFGITVVLPIVSWARLRRATAEIDRLRARLSEVEARLTKPPAPAAAAVPAPTQAADVAAATVPAAEPATVANTEPDAGEQPAGVAPVPVSPAEVARVYAAASAPSPAASPIPAPVTAQAPPSPAPFALEGAETRRENTVRQDTLESRIGGRGLLYIGMAALLFGVAFFVKYAFDNAWINETTRVVLGGLLGAGMATGGVVLARRGYDLYGQVMSGGGFVALYIATWAALNLYGLVTRPTAFVLMVVVTGVAALVADRLGAQALALVAVLGGFFTPAMVGGERDAQVVLFTYLAILAAGTGLLADRHGWPRLTRVAYLLTLLVAWAWADVHYTAAKYATTEAFLVLFAAMFGFQFWRDARDTDVRADPAPAVALATVPLIFHGWSVSILGPHSLPFLVYLMLFTLGGVLISVRWDKAWIRLAVFIAVTPALMTWLGTHRTPGWRVATVVVLLAQYVMHLAAQAERATRRDDAWPKADVVLFHASALALFAGLYAVVDAFLPYDTHWIAIGLGAWFALLAWAIRRHTADGAVNALAAMFAMAGFAIGLRFDDWWAVVGWGIEAGAIYWAGLRTGRDWMRWGGLAVLAGTLARLGDVGFFGTPAGFSAVFNPRAGATLSLVAVIYAMSFFLRRRAGAPVARTLMEYAALLVGANVLTLLLLSVEINSYWHLRRPDDAAANLALLASLSVAWGIYGTALVIVGIMRRYAPIRYLAIALLLLTVGKVFLVDLSELGGVYRIIGFMGLGACLLLGAWLYQRYRDVILGTEG
jgi:uncharacterized membrane protein